jgi:hypothetical protein
MPWGGSWHGQWSGLWRGLPVPTQTFRLALSAKLESIRDLISIVGDSIYPGALPETHDLKRDGPALTWTVETNPRGHVLSGSDGTSTARVQISAWSYNLTDSDAIALALALALDGLFNDTSWGNGTVTIRSCLQEDESDQPDPVETGMDVWVRQVVNTYSIKHTVTIPTL